MSVMQNAHRYKITTNIPPLWIKDFPWKKISGHKYSRGRVVIYGGKKELVGATILSSMAALKTGTGSVKIICSKDTIQMYSVKFPSVLKVEINNISQLKEFIKKESYGSSGLESILKEFRSCILIFLVLKYSENSVTLPLFLVAINMSIYI